MRLRWILLSIGVGGGTAGLCCAISAVWGAHVPIGTWGYSRYVAPVIEEAAKAVFIIPLVRLHKVGFLVDAAILGFAVGTGFAVVENAYYAGSSGDASASTWIIRGFGTATMHSGTTCFFAIVSKAIVDRSGVVRFRAFVPGLILAVAIHSIYNHFFFSPVLGTFGALVMLPLLLLRVFTRSERVLQQWLDVGFDADTELLQLLNSGRLSESPVGRYLQSL